MSRAERKAMVVRGHPDLSLSRQCKVLSIGRSSLYYAPKGESAENLALMRGIEELCLKYPFYGSRQMARQLRRDSVSRRTSSYPASEAPDGRSVISRKCCRSPFTLNEAHQVAP